MSEFASCANADSKGLPEVNQSPIDAANSAKGAVSVAPEFHGIA